MNRRTYLCLLLTLFVVFFLIPSAIKVGYFADDLTRFAWLYLLAAYIRLYSPPLFEKRSFALGLMTAAAVIDIFYAKALDFLSRPIPFVALVSNSEQWMSHSVTSVMLALGLFLFFKNIHVKPSRTINLVASTSLGVYLIHEHPLLWKFLWVRLFHSADYGMQVPGFWLHIAWVVPTVFLMGMVVDLIRQYALERPLFKLIDKIALKRKKIKSQ